MEDMQQICAFSSQLCRHSDVITPLACDFVNEALNLLVDDSLTAEEKSTVKELMSLFNSFCVSVIPRIAATEQLICELEQTQAANSNPKPQPQSQPHQQQQLPSQLQISSVPLPCSPGKKPKKEDSKLTPQSAIEKISGLGRTYCPKLRALGIITVRDLASISPNNRQAVLSQIRKDRGALTDAKFAAKIDIAKSIVERCDGPTPLAAPVAMLSSTSVNQPAHHHHHQQQSLGKRSASQADLPPTSTLSQSASSCNIDNPIEDLSELFRLGKQVDVLDDETMFVDMMLNNGAIDHESFPHAPLFPNL